MNIEKPKSRKAVAAIAGIGLATGSLVLALKQGPEHDSAPSVPPQNMPSSSAPSSPGCQEFIIETNHDALMGKQGEENKVGMWAIIQKLIENQLQQCGVPRNTTLQLEARTPSERTVPPTDLQYDKELTHRAAGTHGELNDSTLYGFAPGEAGSVIPTDYVIKAQAEEVTVIGILVATSISTEAGR